MIYRMKDVIYQTGLSEKAIRLYVQKNLIFPEKEEASGRTNLFFKEEEIEILKRIAILRSLDFSLAEVEGLLYGGEKEERKVLNERRQRYKEEKKKAEVWDFVEKTLVQSEGERLVDNIEYAFCQYFKESCLKPDFSKIEDMEAVENQNIRRIDTRECYRKGYGKMGAALLAALLIILGSCMITYSLTEKRFREIEKSQGGPQYFSYGVKSSDITTTDIEWKDYPGWKEVDFKVSGTIVLQVPQGANINFADLDDRMQNTKMDEMAPAIEESRETMVLSDGEELLYYDEAVYVLENVIVHGNVVESREDNEILKAANGYQWKVTWDSGEYIIGCILPMSEEMQLWSEKENIYAGRNLEAYFSAFERSRVYLDETGLKTRELAQDVSLIQYGESPFCFKIVNERAVDLLYGPGMPDLEMWYDGIWIELKERYDAKPGMYSVCKAGEEFIVEKPEKESGYPYLMPGLYRWVLITDSGECVISNIFEKQ